MEKIEIIKRGGKEIFYVDYSGDQMLQTISRAAALIEKQPSHSVLILSDFSGVEKWDGQGVSRIKDFANHNKPYVRAVALVGITGLKRVILQAVKRFTRRDFVIFDSKEKALDWLMTQ